MAEKRVIEYEAASELANDDWLLIDGVTEGTRKARPNVVTAELGAQVTNIATAVSGLTQVAMGHEQSFAPGYDESASYDVGDLVMQYHCLYRCTAATTGTWDAGKWARTEVSEQLEESGKIDDVQVNGVSVVTDKVASIDLTGMQADIDSKQADTKIGGASILDNNKVANLDFLASYGEASGEIASFNDGAAMPLKSLKVGIEATQDLHGYDYPWAGGSGKNKFGIEEWLKAEEITYTKSGNSYTFNLDNKLYSHKFVFSDTDISTNFNATITIPSGSTASNVGFVLYSQDGTAITGRVSSFSNQTGCKIGLDWSSLGQVTITEAIVTKSTDSVTPFAPYSNICPISGWDECNVGDFDVNIWDEETEFGYYDVRYGNFVSNEKQLCTKNFIPVKSNMTLYGYKGSYTGYGELLFYDKSKNYIGYLSNTQWINKEFTVPSNCFYVTFNLGSAYGTTYNNDISINYPSTDTEYHAYNGHTYTIDLDGTRYGCTLDLVSGVMTVDRAMATVDENSNIISGSGGLPFRIDLLTGAKTSSSASALTGVKCNFLKEVTQSSSWGVDGTFSRVTTDAKIVYFKVNSEITTIQQLKTFLQSNNLQFVYELATPLTIQLTPTQVKSLLGVNNLWADSGDILECKYVRDNSAVINDLIARVTALENE